MASAGDGSHPHAAMAAARLVWVAEFMRDDAEMRFNRLRCSTGLDLLEDNKLVVIYDLHAMIPPSADSKEGYHELLNEFAVRVEVDRDDPHIPTVSGVWPAADWHEREASDMFGIVFDGHPDSLQDPHGLHPPRIL